MIVVAGEALVDLVVAADITAPGAVEARLGGGPYNVARTIGRLGGQAAFCGMLSTDRFGQRFADQLNEDGVAHHPSLRTDLPTTLAVAELDGDGSASYRFYLGGTSSAALEAVPDDWRRPVAVHAGTLGLVLEPMSTTVLAYLESLDDDVVVMVDPNCRSRVISDRDAYGRRIEQACRRADVVKLSVDDAEFLGPGSEPLDVARRFVSDGSAAVLLTGGGGTTFVVTAAGHREIHPPRINVVDTIGAGDSFGGAFLAWWVARNYGRAELADLDLLSEATDAAQEVSAMTCQRVGAQPPRLAELSTRWTRT